MKLSRYKRELTAAFAFGILIAVVGIIAPSFFSVANLRDLALNNAPALVVAIGMTMVILVRQIDISVGSQFAVVSVATAWLAKIGLPIPLLLPSVLLIGAALGAINGVLVAWLRLPSIIVTMAMLVALRDALRWVTEGVWVQDLPANFQWLSFEQNLAQWLIVAVALTVLVIAGWTLRNLRSGRSLYAVGSDAEAARIMGLDPQRVTLCVFVLMGVLVGLAALLNTVRFSSVPTNVGLGLELKVIAAVVVGGTAVTGGRGTLIGTLIGSLLLGTIGTALIFAGINPFWEKAIQGAIILAALISDVWLGRLEHHVRRNYAQTV